MKHIYSKLGKDILIYGIGGLLAKGFTLLALPVYTRIFSPAVFGNIETILIINSFLGIFLTFGMDSAQSFYFSKQKGEGKLIQQKTISAIMQWRLFCAFIIIGIATLLTPLINYHFFFDKLTNFWLCLSYFDACFLQITYQCAEIFRLSYQPTKFLLLLFFHQLFTFFSVSFLVTHFAWGIEGYILGMLLGSLITAIIGIYLIRDYFIFCPSTFSLWPRLLKFGAPLIPAGIALYIIQSVDRWFILHYCGEETLGFYSAGAKVALMFTLGIEVFRKAWWPIALEEIHKPQSKNFIRNIAHIYFGLTTVGALAFTFLSPFLMKILVSEQFEQSYYIAGILSWQGLFWGFYLISSIGLWKNEKTLKLAILTIIASVAKIIFDYLLVPSFGMLGAAISTIIIYFSWNFLTIFYSEAAYKVGYNLPLLSIELILGGIGAASILLYYYNAYNYPIYLYIACLALVLLIYLVLKNLDSQLFREYSGENVWKNL